MDADFFKKMQPRFLTPEEVEQREAVPPSPEVANKAHKPDTDDPYPAVPAELKARRQWVVWLYHFKTEDDKPSKMLYQTNGWAASVSDPGTWTTYPLALTCYQEYSTGKKIKYRYRPNRKAPYQHLNCDLAGIGYVFSPEDPFTGIDLDNCIDANGNIKPWARPIIDKLTQVAYNEVSPNNHGIKSWTQARLPEIAKHKVYINQAADEAIEAYDKVRYFTVTGRGKGKIHNGQAEVDWLVQEYLKPDSKPQPPKRKPMPQSNFKSAGEVIQQIRQSKQCHKFDTLMRGNTTGYGSQSEADIALCSVIVFWTQNSTVIDAIFRQSQLYRDKWDEKHRADGATYGQMTIEKALSQSRKTYTPKNPKTQRRRRETFYEKRAKRRRYR